MTYIYLVENCFGDSKKVYIGKSFHPSARKNHHRKKYGDVIIFTIIDTIPSFSHKDWKPFEVYWISQFRQWGFDVQNQNNGGGGSPQWNDIQKKNRKGKGIGPNPKISQAKLNHPLSSKQILQYNLQGIFLQEYPSIMEARRQNPIGDIDACVQGKQKKAGDFIYFYKDENNLTPQKVSPYVYSRKSKYITLEEKILSKKEISRRYYQRKKNTGNT